MKKQKISQTFSRWLIVCVSIAFVVSAVFSYIMQTGISEKETNELLQLNIRDVKQDILDASDKHLLGIARSVAKEMGDMKVDTAAQSELIHGINRVMERHEISDVHIVNSEGIIVASNSLRYFGYDMASGEQSREFMVLLQGEKELVQSYQPISFDSAEQRKFAGVALSNGGFVQVGYDFSLFQKSIDEQVVALTRNRHVGAGGRILICDKKGNIVSNAKEIDRKKLDMASMGVKPGTVQQGKRFCATVEGTPFYCMMEAAEGYFIIAIVPVREVVMSRNVAVGMTAVMEIVVFLALFVIIWILLKKQIVDNIRRINGSLAQITDGNLDVTVDVRNNEEFNALSDDINTTVDTLKRYIEEAQTRIDQELEFARSVQHAALPSVFPPFPNRTDFDLFARMDTAKEVGGDFYDFFMLGEDLLGFLIADVSGKGIPAAMFMMEAKTLIKSLVESGVPVEQVCCVANEKLCENNGDDMFVTAWLGMLDLKTGVLHYVNAGHNPPLLCRVGEQFAYLKGKVDFVLAGMEGVRYCRQELTLQPGDRLYLYTDGVTEATALDEQMYGEERLLSGLNQAGVVTPRELCAAIKEDVDRFVGDAPQFDDITMLSLTYIGRQTNV